MMVCKQSVSSVETVLCILNLIFPQASGRLYVTLWRCGVCGKGQPLTLQHAGLLLGSVSLVYEVHFDLGSFASYEKLQGAAPPWVREHLPMLYLPCYQAGVTWMP